MNQIWYMKPDYFRNGIMGNEFCIAQNALPDPKDLSKTHVLLKELAGAHLSEIYYNMQGEVWSPKGEANGMIRAKGLQHTSMSVGDVVVKDDGRVYQCDMVGWAYLGNVRPISPDEEKRILESADQEI